MITKTNDYIYYVQSATQNEIKHFLKAFDDKNIKYKVNVGRFINTTEYYGDIVIVTNT